MVINHVEDNLKTVPVHIFDQLLYFVQAAAGQVSRFGSKKAETLVPPVIVFDISLSAAAAEKCMDRQKFYGGYAQPFQIAQNALMIEPGKGTAFAVRHLRVQFGIAFKMGFVNDAFFNGIPRRLNTLPIKIITSYNRFRHIGGAVQRTVREVFERTVPIIAKQCLMPNQTPGELFGIGVNQKLVRIEAMPLFRQIRPVNTIAVNLSRF